MNSPCYKCELRATGENVCHTTCKAYIDYINKLESVKSEMKKDDYFIGNIGKRRRWNNG